MNDGMNDKLNQTGFYASAFNEKSLGTLDFTTKQMTLENVNGLTANLTVADAGEMLAALGGNPASVADKTLAFDLAIQTPNTPGLQNGGFLTMSGGATYDKNSGVWTYDGDPANPKQSCVLKFSRAANNTLAMTVATPENCAAGEGVRIESSLTSDKFMPTSSPLINLAIPKR
jgi:hypothetical protein